MTVVAATYTAIYAELPRIELKGVRYDDFTDSQRRSNDSNLTLKEYVWNHCQEQILAALKVDTIPKTRDTTTSTKSLFPTDILNGCCAGTPPPNKTSAGTTATAATASEGDRGLVVQTPLFSINNKKTATKSSTDDSPENDPNNKNKNDANNSGNNNREQFPLQPLTISTQPQEKQQRVVTRHNSGSSSSQGLLIGSPRQQQQQRHGHKRSPSTQLEWMQQDVAQATRRLQLLDKMSHVQQQYLQMADSKTVFNQLLASILDLTESEYGFIGEMRYEHQDDQNDNDNDNNEKNSGGNSSSDNGEGTIQQSNEGSSIVDESKNDEGGSHSTIQDTRQQQKQQQHNANSKKQNKNHMYLQMHAISNVAWDAATRKFYDDNINSGLRFDNQKSLFGTVMTTQKPVLSNEPETDPRRCGIPPGHPPLNAFLGIPLFDSDGNMNGMVGIANKKGGYSYNDIEFLEPFITICGNLTQAYRTLPKTPEEKLYELELANIQLAQAHQRVVRQSALQLQHFACASHEIRTPLNCIIGLSSLLQETELNPMQAESMQLISSSSELLLTVVNDVLDYSKLESGHVAVTIQPSNLQETLMAVIQSLELKKRDKNIRVRTEYAPSLSPHWNTDRLRLQQILFNLLGNAFKFSDNNSCIDLKVELGPPNRPAISAHATPLRVPRVLRFIVRDYGCGIHPDQLVNVFQPFVQAGDDTHRLYEGTGLGLAITSKLVQALGGCVYANSTLGAGSEFCVEFPYEQDEFDVESVADQMRNTIVLLIPGQNMPEDNVPVMEKLLTTYQMNYRILSSMDDLDHVILQGSQSNSLTDLSQASQTSVSDGSDDSLSQHHDMIFLPKDRAYLCLVDESVYEREVWQRWKEHHSPTVLLTFGPDYTVPETSNHYRNLLQILPSVLVQSLADSMEEAKALKAPKIKGRRRKMTFSRAKKPNAPVREKQDISILVVEDNVINQKVLIALLKKIGYTQVDVVGDGSMAVDAVEHNKYDIVLMDVQMPVMDGLEATKIIGERQQEKFVQGDKTPAPKIVFVTASVDQELEEQAAKLGAVGFVPKPFNLRQLETCMTELCKSLT